MARRIAPLVLLLTIALAFWPGDSSAQSSITITAPSPGAVVPVDQVAVSGTATAVPNGPVVVQALGPGSVVLREASITMQDAVAGTGPWEVTLQFSPVAPGTVGQVYVFSTAAEGGVPAAQASVDVTYGQGAAPQSAIVIEQPQPGTAVEAAAFTVSGQGTALPDNILMVEAQDDSGSVLTPPQSATVNAPAGGAGPWQVTFSVQVAAGTPGRIVAYSTSPADGSRVAEATVDVTYGQPAPPSDQPSVLILSPSPGSVISEGSVEVAGSAAVLPDNTVVVQALDANGALLAEQSATVDAAPGGSGPWRAVLSYPAQPVGSQGRIYAFARQPGGGNLVAESAVDVAFGSAPVEPVVTPETEAVEETLPARPGNLVILRPANGAVLFTERPIDVAGRVQDPAAGEISVQVLAPNGALLAESTATPDQTGSWAAALTVGRVNTPATVYAFVRSPVDGSVADDDAVFVRLASAVTLASEPRPPAMAITAPIDGAVVDTAGGFVVAGVVSGAYQNNVMVRVRDAYGRTLRQLSTTADELGNWSVVVRMLVANGAPGTIYAFTVSPADGAIVADDLVRVTFTSRCELRTDWQTYVVQPGDSLIGIAQATGSTARDLLLANCLNNPNHLESGQRVVVPQLPPADEPTALTPEVTIQSPAGGAVIDLASPLVVAGASNGSLPGSVFVRILDNAGAVIGETRANVVTEADAAGVWTWQAQFDASTLPPGSRGAVFAYLPSPRDGQLQAAAASNVIFGAVEPAPPFVTIESPLPYAAVGADGNVLVTGRGGGLLDGTVVVQLLDSYGNVRAQMPTTIASEQPGGEGEWRIVLPMTYVGRGKVSAFSANPADGSITAATTRSVIFGDPGAQPTSVLITFPLPGTIVTGEGPVTALAGYARGTGADAVQVMIYGQGGRLLFWQPAAVDPATGLWTLVTAEPLDIQSEQELVVQVVAVDPTYGTVAAEDRMQLRLVRPRVTGTVSSPGEVTLPATAVLSISIQNTSAVDAPPEAVQLARQVIVNPGQMPIEFAIPYNPADVDGGAAYGVIARIEDGLGNLLYTNAQPTPVLTQGNPTAGVAVVVEPAQ